jgi:hypothetical protein
MPDPARSGTIVQVRCRAIALSVTRDFSANFFQRSHSARSTVAPASRRGELECALAGTYLSGTVVCDHGCGPGCRRLNRLRARCGLLDSHRLDGNQRRLGDRHVSPTPWRHRHRHRRRACAWEGAPAAAVMAAHVPTVHLKGTLARFRCRLRPWAQVGDRAGEGRANRFRRRARAPTHRRPAVR